ncbi:uncharacterized protein C2orf42 homolog [Dendroctonus ponderosae]|uniref:Putative treble-clef zinc-finger domain-containing protein n=2 Tax=Dendroctonus ponderosae TaxID=77166 RepID=A0AAR5P3E4_DENPD|nr:uncharacterized protein C2orf42 homolog [Dendroctonus ponderosae]KAH1010428.1 hypothetical protein HUJ05_004728 [Dendroctonus ponderosae]
MNYTITSNRLQGLGKPTRRGVKKCPRCATFNGTRGLVCKNKQCAISLKASQDLADWEAVQLITGTVRQVYSVRVKEGGRGFVQIPFSAEDIRTDSGLCFVESCQRSFDNSILKCHEEEQSATKGATICSHIDMALKSRALAQPLELHEAALERLEIPVEMKSLLRVYSEGSPLVQMVSREVVAVKCQVSPKQPLGYLHFTFVKGRSKAYDKYRCSCTFGFCEPLSTTWSKCIHYYASVAALASNQNCMEQFASFLTNEVTPRNKSVGFSYAKVSKFVDLREAKSKAKAGRLIKKTVSVPNKEIPKPAVHSKKERYLIKRCKKIAPKIYPIEIKVLNEQSLMSNPMDKVVSWMFSDWLSFVTESINKTMQFINCGIVNTQVFYIPEDFFGAFCCRIPAGYQEQKTAMGSIFYSIMNVNHVKEIFDTPKVKLRIAKKFILADHKGYIEYDDNESVEERGNHTQYHSAFIFFLNVGQSTVDESDNCNNAFIVEWLPNICSTIHVGQLKVQYKYGRKSI